MTTKDENKKAYGIGWNWWVSHDGEEYYQQCDTKEEAIAVALENEEGWICEAYKPKLILADFFHVDDFLDNVEDRHWDDLGDPHGDRPIFDIDKDSMKELEVLVKSAINTWQNNQDKLFSGWKFSQTRNEEYVTKETHGRSVRDG